MTDMINHPPHYANGPACLGCGRGIECLDVTSNMSFLRGNVLKYIWRAPYKGTELQDLQKASFYLQREIERVEMKSVKETNNGSIH